MRELDKNTNDLIQDLFDYGGSFHVSEQQSGDQPMVKPTVSFIYLAYIEPTLLKKHTDHLVEIIGGYV
jgi:hypothetical protein